MSTVKRIPGKILRGFGVIGVGGKTGNDPVKKTAKTRKPRTNREPRKP